MLAANAKQKIDTQIESLERKLQRLKALRDALEDEDIADEVGELFESSTKNGIPKSLKRSPKSLNLRKIVRFFEKRNNTQATIKEICKATSLSFSSVKQMLYRSHCEYFDRESQVGGGRETLFRLVNNVEETAKSQ